MKNVERGSEMMNKRGERVWKEATESERKLVTLKGYKEKKGRENEQIRK